MSRSFKKQPFMAITGRGSAKQDKIMAHQGERRAHKAAIHNAIKLQEYDVILPHRRECRWNNVYCWSRDGKQMYQALDNRDWQRYLESDSEDDYFGQWPPLWYSKMLRK
jgi:hypothetical protein